MPVPPRRLSASLLAALGVTSSCTASPCLKMTPCLDYAVDTDTGPCLTQVIDSDTADDTAETATGPCLSQPPDSDSAPDTGDTADTGRAQRQARSVGEIISGVLERQVLPEDVVKRLRERQK